MLLIMDSAIKYRVLYRCPRDPVHDPSGATAPFPGAGWSADSEALRVAIGQEANAGAPPGGDVLRAIGVVAVSFGRVGLKSGA